MKTLVKLLISFLVAFACWRAGNAYYRYYRFADAVQSVAQFAAGKSDSELQSRVMDIAGGLGLPVRAENVVIRREDNHTRIDAVYTDRIELVPTWFYPREFKVKADAFTLETATPVRSP